MIAMEKNTNNFQYASKILKDDDGTFQSAFQQDKEILRNAIERMRKIIIQPYIYRFHSC